MSYYYDCCNQKDERKEKDFDCKRKDEKFCCKKIVEEKICCYPQPWGKKEEDRKEKDCDYGKKHGHYDGDCKDCYKHDCEEKYVNKDEYGKDCWQEKECDCHKDDGYKEKDGVCGTKRQRCNCFICNFFRNFRC